MLLLIIMIIDNFHYGNVSVLFYLHIVSKSTAELYAVVYSSIWSHINLPCLVNLALHSTFFFTK